MKIKNLLSNMGQRELETYFLGTIVLETLKYYNEDLALPSKMRKLVFEKITKEEMLRDRNMRNALINSIRNDDDVTELARNLKIPQGNDRKNLLSMKIRKDSPREKKLFEFFEVEYKNEEKEIKNLPNKNIISTQMPLFCHQKTAVNEIESYLNGNLHAGLLHMPTGSGKTRATMRIISNLFIRCVPTVVIWLALTEELCEQAICEFEQTWNAVGDRDLPLFRFFGDHSPEILKEIDKKREGLIVASMSKLERVKNEQFLLVLADRVNLVVMDEAHHATAPTYKETIQILTKHTDTKLLGLSATPGRTLEDSEENLELASFFGTNRAKLKIKNQNPVRYLIDNGYISKPNMKTIEHSTKLTESDLKLISKKLDIPPNILEKLGSDVRRNIKIIDTIEDLVNNYKLKRIIVFTPNIKTSRSISTILSAKGFNSYYVDSHLSNQRRADIIKQYKQISEKEMIICNVNMLTTGFDAPKTSAVVIARPTKSLVLYSQMIGRGIRGEKVGGTKKCFIRVIADTSIMDFKSIVDAFDDFEGHWK